MKEPDRNIYTNNDRAEYAETLKQTSAMKHGNNPASNKPKSSKEYKYKVIIKPIWEALYGTVGRGLKAVVIPSASGALVDRLELLLASKVPGNTGLRNELVSICDELLRQKVMTKPVYKKNYLTYIKMLRRNNRRLKNQYAFGGSGILDSILKFIVKTFASQGAKALALSAAKEVAKTSLETGKSVAVEAGKKLVDKVLNPPKRVENIVKKYTDGSATDIQQMVRKLNGSGLKEI